MFLCVCSVEYLPEQAQLWPVFEHPNPGHMVTRNTPLHAPYSSRLAKVGPSGSCQQSEIKTLELQVVITLLHEPINSVDPPKRENGA